jgi:hypothetical protein
MIRDRLPDLPTTESKTLQPSPDGQTTYDPAAGVTWLADANLAAAQTFGIGGIMSDGSMDHTAALQWVEAMNKVEHGRGYLGQVGIARFWPARSDLQHEGHDRTAAVGDHNRR